MTSRLTLSAIALNAVLLGTGLALISPGQKKAPGPAGLHLHWVRELAPLEPTWPDQPRFTSDIARQPVPAGDLVLLSCSRTDSLLALNAATGAVQWRFTCDGPVRFAPAVWRDRVYVASDDGHLHCLDLTTGKSVWSFRGGPTDRRILGNERLISTWPVRGAPAVAVDGTGKDEKATVYFAAGIWPFMGIFIYALDCASGEVRWSNTGDGSTYIRQPHNTDAFAGIAPQGSMVIDGDRLFVPGGRSVPACYDRHTGKLLHYRLAENSKRGGGPDVVAGAGIFVNGGGAFDQKMGKYLGAVSEPVAVHGSTLYSISGGHCRAFDLEARPNPSKIKSKAKKGASEAWLGEYTARVAVPRSTAVVAGVKRLYGSGVGKVYSLALPLKDGARPLAEASISGTPIHVAIAGERLFVSTREGRIYAFGPTAGAKRRLSRVVTPLPAADRTSKALADEILQIAKTRQGYAVVWGAGSGGLATELHRRTDHRLIVVEPDADRASALRKHGIAADLDFKRLAVLSAKPAEAHLPLYLCELMAAEDLSGFVVDDAFFDVVYRSLRPYGGMACLPLSEKQRGTLARWQKKEPTAKVRQQGELTLIVRAGALPGAGSWTHQHANAANTRVSSDTLVKAPLGILWFGGPGNQSILPRHGHGPVPQAIDGRLIIEGTDLLRAIDVYTGRLLWETKLPGLGKTYNNMSHQPGANATGTNYVSMSDGVYVAYQRRCVRLDPETGKIVQRYELPPLKGEKTPPEWTFIAAQGRYLIAGVSARPNPAPSKSKKGRSSFRGQETSRRLSVLDRKSGKVLWQAEAEEGWRHNAICAGGGRLYAIDRKPLNPAARPSKNGKVEGRLMCFDLASGKKLWTKDEEVFGTWLSYSADRDIVVEAGLMARDTLYDEAPGMRAYDAATGKERWHHERYYGPAMIHGDMILKGGDMRAGSGTACDIRTGKAVNTSDPLTGEKREWRWIRNYGCNTPAACKNMIFFRSGAAGFYDLANEGGTGNFGGFRSSCTMNLIASGGVLTIPDYTRSCTCSYQNQASVGLVHSPEAELWTFTQSKTPSGVIRRAGINFGAPGGRLAENRTLWVEYPAVGGPSPRLAITAVPAKPETFRWHQGLVKGDGPAWVASSGLRGVRRLTIRLGPDKSPVRKYTVRLVFMEPDGLTAGKRIFDVSVQGIVRLRELDVSKEAEGPGRGLVRLVKGVEVSRDLEISLVPATGSMEPVLCGVEVIAED